MIRAETPFSTLGFEPRTFQLSLASHGLCVLRPLKVFSGSIQTVPGLLQVRLVLTVSPNSLTAPSRIF